MGVEGPRSVGGGVSGCRGPIGLHPWLPTTGMPGPHPLADGDGVGGRRRLPDADIWGCPPATEQQSSRWLPSSFRVPLVSCPPSSGRGSRRPRPRPCPVTPSRREVGHHLTACLALALGCAGQGV